MKIEIKLQRSIVMIKNIFFVIFSCHCIFGCAYRTKGEEVSSSEERRGLCSFFFPRTDEEKSHLCFYYNEEANDTCQYHSQVMMFGGKVGYEGDKIEEYEECNLIFLSTSVP
jgi:hypothetical protein